MTVPFVDLKRQYILIREEIDSAISDVINQTAFIGGHFVKSFEKDFAELYGVDHCIGVANGTDAIYITLKMLGIKEGDEVITVANSWISTAETITQAGARVVFVDVDEHFTIDVNKLEEAITPRTKAIIPVHLYGQPADMDPIVAICKKYGLFLIEDCAQSHFSEYKGRYTGSFGIASTFSFYPGKNLGAYGDAGAILTNDEKLAEKCRMFSNHGALKKHHHLIEGINSRLDGLQANVLKTKLRYLLKWNSARIQNAKRYDELLASLNGVERPEVRPDCTHTYHLYVIKAEKRDELKTFLAKNGIETYIHYPTLLPLLPCYQYLGATPQDFPRGYANQSRILSLPMFPELTEDQIQFVCKTIREFYTA